MNGHFEVYRDDAGEFRWRYVAGNGATMADSAEGYTERNDAVEALWVILGDIDRAQRSDGVEIRGQTDTA